MTDDLRHRLSTLNATHGILAAATFAACAKTPQPPPPLPEPEPPRVEKVSFEDRLPELDPPQPLPPRLRWTPSTPGEGTMVVLTIEPEPRGLPIFEAMARARERDLVLAPFRGGGYLSLLAAPRSTEDVPVEVTVTFIDGTQLTQRLSLRVTARDFSATRLRVAPRYTAPDEATLSRIRKEREWVRAALGVRTEVHLWRGPFIRPLEGVTTSPYGQRRMFNNEVRSQHTGLDIDGDTGDPVVATNSGRVLLSRDLFFSGQAVYIDHGLGFITGYFHLSKREVSEGAWVEKGEVVGLVGATGRVTGPHLHWSVFVQGVAIDPLSLLELNLEQVSRRLFAPPPGFAPTP